MGSCNVFLQYHNCDTFEKVIRKGMSVSTGVSDFRYLRYLLNDFHSGFSSLRAHWTYSRVPLSPCPQQYLLLSDIFMVVLFFFFFGIKWYFHLVLICNALMARHYERFVFVHLLALGTFLLRCVHLFQWPLLR